MRRRWAVYTPTMQLCAATFLILGSLLVVVKVFFLSMSGLNNLLGFYGVSKVVLHFAVRVLLAPKHPKNKLKMFTFTLSWHFFGPFSRNRNAIIKLIY